ncbi:MAG: RnfH family protein [Xanthomonadales bacterium]|nr:RnfH family protein [Xanthomonadales bacterium]
MRVEVVFALPDRQWRRVVELPEGATVREAVERSGLLAAVPGLRLEEGMVGVWYRLRPLDSPLADGDRVELYRPLLADPRTARRRRAGRG